MEPQNTNELFLWQRFFLAGMKYWRFEPTCSVFRLGMRWTFTNLPGQHGLFQDLSLSMESAHPPAWEPTLCICEIGLKQQGIVPHETPCDVRKAANAQNCGWLCRDCSCKTQRSG
jgi:hypothetical protein